MRDVLDIHTHTLASGHAYSTISEMAAYAKEMGLELLGITEHAPKMPGTCHEFYFNNLKVVPREFNGMRLLLGAELNILDYDGNVDLSDRTLSELDVCVASIHPPCFTSGTQKENTRAYLKAMEIPKVAIIGHPDDGRFPIDYEELVLGAKANHVLLELNQGSLGPKSFRKNSRENAITMLEYCKKYQVPVIMDSDAHITFDICNHEGPLSVVEECHFPEELIVNRSVEEFMKFVQ